MTTLRLSSVTIAVGVVSVVSLGLSGCFWIQASGSLGAPVAGDTTGPAFTGRLGLGVHFPSEEGLTAVAATIAAVHSSVSGLPLVHPALGFELRHEIGPEGEERFVRPMFKLNIDVLPVSGHDGGPPPPRSPIEQVEAMVDDIRTLGDEHHYDPRQPMSDSARSTRSMGTG